MRFIQAGAIVGIIALAPALPAVAWGESAGYQGTIVGASGIQHWASSPNWNISGSGYLKVGPRAVWKWSPLNMFWVGAVDDHILGARILTIDSWQPGGDGGTDYTVWFVYRNGRLVTYVPNTPIHSAFWFLSYGIQRVMFDYWDTQDGHTAGFYVDVVNGANTMEFLEMAAYIGGTGCPNPYTKYSNVISDFRWVRKADGMAVQFWNGGKWALGTTPRWNVPGGTINYSGNLIVSTQACN